MLTATTLAGAVAIALYLIATRLVARGLLASADSILPHDPALSAANDEHASRRRTALFAGILSAGGIIGHGLMTYGLLLSGQGLQLDLLTALVVLLLIATLFVAASSFVIPVGSLLLYTLPGSAIAIALRLLLPYDAEPIRSLPTPLILHILFALIAYGILIMGATQSIIVGYQESRLRRRDHNALLATLPPMETMERLLFAMIWLGFAVLTIAIVTGFLYLEDLFAQRVVHHTVLASMSWLVYATLLTGRYLFGWRGTIAVRFTMVAFVLLLLAYLGSKFVIEVLLVEP
ncbi:MAG: cytochrome c biogenesis protein CcsA [Pseudomonadota bacterium]